MPLIFKPLGLEFVFGVVFFFILFLFLFWFFFVVVGVFLKQVFKV